MVMMGKVELAGKGAQARILPLSEHIFPRPGWAAELWHRMLSWERVPGHPDHSLFLDSNL